MDMNKFQELETPFREMADRMARFLWENVRSQYWDEAAPEWLELKGAAEYNQIPKSRREREKKALYSLEYTKIISDAARILSLDCATSLRFAALLIENADRDRKKTEVDLWRKIERAAGFEEGSLTGKPGVAQRVFI